MCLKVRGLLSSEKLRLIIPKYKERVYILLKGCHTLMYSYTLRSTNVQNSKFYTIINFTLSLLNLERINLL